MQTIRNERRWCLWRAEVRDGKTTKVPYRTNGSKAKSNDPSTWTDYETAKAALDASNGFYSGVGLFFSGTLCGLDVDGDHDRGERNPLEGEILDRLSGTYAERSPSGLGVHFIFRADPARIPSVIVNVGGGERVKRLDPRYYSKNSDKGLEFYAGGLTNRFFTFTEKRISVTDVVTDRTDALLAVLEDYMLRPERPEEIAALPVPAVGGEAAAPTDPAAVDVDERLRMALNSRNRGKFIRLFHYGDASEYDGDRSRADLALCGILAWWLDRNPGLIDRAFRASALYRTKWDERRGAVTYGEMTIAKSLTIVRECYSSVKKDFVHVPRALTDVGNAELFADLHGHELRWCDALGWLVWDGSVWTVDDRAAGGVAVAFVEDMLEDAKETVKRRSSKNDDGKADVDSGARDFYRHAIKSQSANGLYNMLKIARELLAIKADKLDADPCLLNTEGGIVDLRTGEIAPHDPAAFCTKMAPFVPSSEGREKWEAFLDLVTSKNEDLKKYLRLVAGMSIIGTVKSEGIQIAFGGGRNGKSTYYNTLQNVLGGYAGTLSADVLTTDRGQNKGAALATLRGKRLVVCGELEEGQRLSIKELKRVATTDRLVIEKKYRDPEEIRPSHHVCMFTNHLPRVGSTDGGTWRRLAVIPFTAVMPEGDAEIKDYAEVLARDAGGAVLKWMIEGAVEFLADGCRLTPPAGIETATRSYKEREDWLAPFVNERCVKDPGAESSAGDLYTAYRLFATERGDAYVHNGRDFKEGLVRFDFKNVTKKGRSFWKGVRLKNVFEMNEPLDDENDKSDDDFEDFLN